MAVQSTAMAAQNLLLAARVEGLGACIMCAPLFCPDVVIESLQLPPQWRAQMLVTIGEPAAPGKERPRLPLSEIAQWHSDR
jgi:coenzyme F420-0:L-glutamate ligase / coenzyme F420-1:gamma-L-glutamate ligase